MTDSEMQNQISEERRKGEHEKKCAVARTILTIVGIVTGLVILGKFGTGDTAEQWGGMILLALVISALVWIYGQITKE